MSNSLLPKDYYKSICLISSVNPAVNGWHNYKTAFFLGVPSSETTWQLFLLSSLDAFQINHEIATEVYTSRPSPTNGATVLQIQEDCLSIDTDANAAVLDLGSLEVDKDFSPGFFKAEDIENIPVDENVQQWEGRLILTPGYPDQMALLKPDYPIVRGGVIARIGDLMDHLNEWLLIDANIFPSHEGAPVFLQPWPLQIKERTLYKPWLIGMVSGSVNFQRTNGLIDRYESAAVGMVCPFFRIIRLMKGVTLGPSITSTSID